VIILSESKNVRRTVIKKDLLAQPGSRKLDASIDFNRLTGNCAGCQTPAFLVLILVRQAHL
jgi:hypothetical protein